MAECLTPKKRWKSFESYLDPPAGELLNFNPHELPQVADETGGACEQQSHNVTVTAAG